MNMPVQDFYRNEYTRIESLLPGQRVPWVREMRNNALECFLSMGLPTTREEDWKYTSLKALQRRRFGVPDRIVPVPRERVERYLPPGTGASVMVFVNGVWSPGLSTRNLPDGVTARSLSGVLEDAPESLHGRFGSLIRTGQPGFISLATSLMRDGACVLIGKGVQCEAPLHMLFVHTGNTLAPIRNLIVIEEGARATLVERHVALDIDEYLATGVSEIVAGSRSQLTHCRLMEDNHAAFHVMDTSVELEASSGYVLHDISVGARLLRNNMQVVINDSDARCALNALSLARRRQHVDNHVRVEHASPGGSSQQSYRAVLKDHARSVFDGRVIVHRDAQKSDACQASHNLLLSGEAEADAKPQLEIHADDVKCAHGCTVGQLDADALFYLRSRGLDEAGARRMLVHGFATETLDRIHVDTFRRLAETRLEAYLQ